eukprot:957890-Pleurochrysis_carterae.AAC.1
MSGVIEDARALFRYESALQAVQAVSHRMAIFGQFTGMFQNPWAGAIVSRRRGAEQATSGATGDAA